MLGSANIFFGHFFPKTARNLTKIILGERPASLVPPFGTIPCATVTFKCMIHFSTGSTGTTGCYSVVYDPIG